MVWVTKLNCTSVAPGRGGDCDKIKCFTTGCTGVESVDTFTAMLDNFCLENLEITAEEAEVGAKEGSKLG